MRSPLILIVAVAFTAINFSLPLPTVHGQTTAEILPNRTGSPPNSPPRPNNTPSVGIGNVEVRNMSGGTVKVHYTLPTGKTYSYNGNSNSRLWVQLGNGGTDVTTGIAANTRVSVDGFVEEAFVPQNSTVFLSQHQHFVAKRAHLFFQSRAIPCSRSQSIPFSQSESKPFS